MCHRYFTIPSASELNFSWHFDKLCEHFLLKCLLFIFHSKLLIIFADNGLCISSTFLYKGRLRFVPVFIFWELWLLLIGSYIPSRTVWLHQSAILNPRTSQTHQTRILSRRCARARSSRHKDFCNYRVWAPKDWGCQWHDHMKALKFGNTCLSVGAMLQLFTSLFMLLWSEITQVGYTRKWLQFLTAGFLW